MLLGDAARREIEDEGMVKSLLVSVVRLSFELTLRDFLLKTARVKRLLIVLVSAVDVTTEGGSKSDVLAKRRRVAWLIRDSTDSTS